MTRQQGCSPHKFSQVVHFGLILGGVEQSLQPHYFYQIFSQTRRQGTDLYTDLH